MFLSDVLERGVPVSRCSALAFVALLSVVPCAASAFDLRGHLYVAGATLRALDAGGGSSIELDGLGSLPIMNDEAALAVRRFPAYFRAGSLGPDVFPDPVVGRADGHADKGNRAGLDLERCRATPGCVPGGVPFEERTFAQWRPVDYGMLLLLRASRYRRGERAPGAVDEHLQAVAFAYGYLGHVAADGFGEAWASEWAGTDADALFGPRAAILRRLAVERYLDARLPRPAADDTTVSIPAGFLGELYRSELTTTDGLPRAAPAGALGGEYLVRLLELRATFGELADSSGWRHLGRKQWPKDVVRLLALREATSGGSDPGPDAVREIEGFFESRRTIVDEVIDGWIRLSGCVAQNLARGAARPGATSRRDDACAGAFEAGPGVADVFRGELDRAAHHGVDDARVDLGALGPNLEKQRRFAAAVSARVLELGDGAAALLEPTVSQSILRRVIQPRAAALEASLQSTYLGTFASSLASAHDAAARLRRYDDGRALARLAFLAFDLQRDPGYAGRLIGGIAGTACAEVDAAQPLEAAAGACHERTVARGVARLRAVVVPAWGTYETAWRGLVELLLRLAVDPASVTGERLRDPAWAWLSQLRFRDSSRAADSAVGQLVSLLDVVEGLSAVPAPTEQALDRELVPGDAVAAPIDVNAFHPLHNALVVNRLGLLGRDGLENLGKVAGLSQAPFGFFEAAFTGTPGAAARHRPSQICAVMPHVVCDATPSLDDPNAAARTPARGSGLRAALGVDPGRSLAVWRAAADPRAPGACELGLTSFLLAGRVETVRRIYGRVFTYPARCRAASVIIESIAHEPRAVEPGNEVTVRVAVANVGQVPSAPTTLGVALAGRPLTAHEVPMLEPGQALEFAEKVRVDTEGALEVTAALATSGEDLRHTVVVSEVPDLAVSITHSGPGLDGMLSFTATVRNLGKGRAAASTLLFTTPAAPDGAEHEVPALAPGSRFDVVWSTVPILRVYAVTAVADFKGAVPEHDRANNEARDWLDLARDHAVFVQYLGTDAGVVVAYERTFIRAGTWLSVGVGGRPSLVLVPVTASILVPLLDRSWDIELELGVGGVVSYVTDDVARGPFRVGFGLAGMLVGGARVVLGDLRLRASYNPTYCCQRPGVRELLSLGAGWVF